MTSMDCTPSGQEDVESYGFDTSHDNIALVISNSEFNMVEMPGDDGECLELVRPLLRTLGISVEDTVIDCPNRQGAGNDAKLLEDMFRTLGFKDVRILRDLKARDMLEAVMKVAVDAANRNVDCISIAISSHGRVKSESGLHDSHTETLLGTDNKEVAVAQILQFFSESNCEALIGKPKLFFFQCCRGKKIMKYVNLPQAAGGPCLPPPPAQMTNLCGASIAHDADRFGEQATPLGEVSQPSAMELGTEDDNVERAPDQGQPPQPPVVHGNRPSSVLTGTPTSTDEGVAQLWSRDEIRNTRYSLARDYIVVWPAPPGNVSLHFANGSLFFIYLSYVIQNHYKMLDLVSMLTLTNDYLAHYTAPPDTTNQVLAACASTIYTEEMLRKDVVFYR